MLSITHQQGQVGAGTSYTYDAAGNRTARTDFVPGSGQIVQSYTYDSIYQLSQAVVSTIPPTTTETYTYDKVGNRLSSLGITPYTYNSSNQLASKPGTTYTYDANGNALSKTDLSGTTSYTWDFENRLISVTLPGTGGTANFKYDPFGRRTQKGSLAGVTNYVYDGDNGIEELSATGAVTAQYTQGLGIDEPLAMYRNGGSFFYHADGLGSIAALTDTTGSPAAAYVYDSFGNTFQAPGSVPNPFRYTAREFDSETGLYYYRARYYDPMIGRFMSEDSTGQGALGEDRNLYVYVENSPTNFVDPFGLYTLKAGVPPPSPEIDALLKCIESKSRIPLVVTSTTDRHAPGTPHARGVAADLRYNPGTVDQTLCTAAACGAGFGLDEKKHPSPQAQGAHIHLQIPRGKRGGRGDLPSGKCCGQ